MKQYLIAPSILSADFARLGEDTAKALAAGAVCGLRVNPEHSTQDTPIYDPCAPGSRLGVRRTDFDETALDEGDPFAPLLDALQRENVVVFDVESTGVDTAKDEIVQIAAIRLGRDGAPKERFMKFLRPERSVGSSEAVHGFSD